MALDVYVCTDHEGQYQSVQTSIEACQYHFREWNYNREVTIEKDSEDPDKINVYQDNRLVGKIIKESV